MRRYEEDMAYQKDKIYHVAFKGDWSFLLSLADSYKSAQQIHHAVS